MKTKRPRRKAFYKQIAETIIEMGEIDYAKDGNGYPTIHWMIAEYMLRKATPHVRNTMLYGPENWPGRVMRLFYDATTYARDELDTKIKWDKPASRRVIQRITIDPDDELAKDQDFSRLVNRIASVVGASMKHATKVLPDRLDQFKVLDVNCQKLLPPAE